MLCSLSQMSAETSLMIRARETHSILFSGRPRLQVNQHGPAHGGQVAPAGILNVAQCRCATLVRSWTSTVVARTWPFLTIPVRLRNLNILQEKRHFRVSGCIQEWYIRMG